jgi:hypothetical protein
MTSQGDLHVLEINDPKTEDECKYVCQCLDVKSEAYLEVEPGDPVYKFVKKLGKETHGYTTRETLLECQTNSPKAPVKWYKNDDLIINSKKYLIEEDKSAKKYLRIQDSDLSDSATYTCKISNEEFTTTNLTIADQMFKFMRVLKSLRVNEHDAVTLECELDDMEGQVTWFKDGLEVTAANKDYEITCEGRKRRLHIKQSKINDEGKFVCKVRGDETDCEVLVERKYSFTFTFTFSPLPSPLPSPLSLCSCQSIQEKTRKPKCPRKGYCDLRSGDV